MDLALVTYRAMANYIPPKLDCDVLAISCEYQANIFEWSTEPWIQTGAQGAIAPLFPVGISPVLQLTLRFWRVY